MAVDDRAFRKALGSFPSGVTVVTAMDDDDVPAGVTVSAFTSVSLDPPLILVNLADKTSRLSAFTSGHFAVHILSEEQRDVSIRFASRSDERWEGFKWSASDNGVPVFDGCTARIECAVEQVVQAGDHKVVIGRVVDLTSDEGKSPLMYWRGGYRAVGDAL